MLLFMSYFIMFFYYLIFSRSNLYKQLIGEWNIVRIPTNGIRNDDVENQIYGVEIHNIQDDLVGSIYRNDMEDDDDVKADFTAFVDLFKLNIAENKIKLEFTKINTNLTIEMEYEEMEGQYAIVGILFGEEFTINFINANTANVLYNATQYIFEREIQPPSNPNAKPPNLKKKKDDSSKEAENTQESKESSSTVDETPNSDISLMDTILDMIRPYYKYKFILYTILIALVAEIIIMKLI